MCWRGAGIGINAHTTRHQVRIMLNALARGYSFIMPFRLKIIQGRGGSVRASGPGVG